MPTLNLVTQLTLNDLLVIVSKLDDYELIQFEQAFQDIKQKRAATIKSEAKQIAASHRLSNEQENRLTLLLQKQSQTHLSTDEIIEVDSYIEALDEALDQTATDLWVLAQKRQPHKAPQHP